MRIAILLAGVLGAASVVQAAPAPHDENGVRAAETAWSQAFMSGDAAVLDQLLDAGYVSISASGSPRAKAEIIALAKSYAQKHPGAQPSAFPATSTIQVIGDAAVVTHHNPTEISTDTFYYAGGQWHAWISQHTAIKTQ